MGRIEYLAKEMIKRINITFPNAFNVKSQDDQVVLINMWANMLKDYPEPVIGQAFKNCMSTAEFAPKIGTIGNECKRLMSMANSSDEQLWNEFSKALKKIEYSVYNLSSFDREKHINFIKQIYDGLSEEIKEYCSCLNEFVRIQKEEDRTFLKQKFFTRLPNIRERIETKKTMPQELYQMIMTTGDKLRLT